MLHVWGGRSAWWCGPPDGRGEERCWRGKSQQWEWGGALRPAHAMRERKERMDERRKKTVVFWFINFKKHING